MPRGGGPWHKRIATDTGLRRRHTRRSQPHGGYGYRPDYTAREDRAGKSCTPVHQILDRTNEIMRTDSFARDLIRGMSRNEKARAQDARR